MYSAFDNNDDNIELATTEPEYSGIYNPHKSEVTFFYTNMIDSCEPVDSEDEAWHLFAEWVSRETA